ncbi:aminotransferase class V-fold PLP-dependent enzyme [Corynebacterium breve]|uniref:Aminotransferase class V-fold PLP-dependent enzyme n=1 Tax=Corynebacterium breve TaxID=3049799 RepID=A0ABY8VFI5_9CORY|nr:aminotransferase class V-fold PLP-dependent enzyme [Corynebacterium breve]WIM67877.1 aminotransferase class V-fold PLP-dependent enzyme [Corynebacterium breve]
MTYDVYQVRGLYTSLSDGWTYLNAHDCPQIPERVSAAVARSFRMATQAVRPDQATGNRVVGAVGKPEGLGFIDDARHAIADLVGAAPECVVLGPNLPALYAALASSMRPFFRYNSSIVLSAMDDPALLVGFKDVKAETRWAQPDLGTGELPSYQYDELVDGSTRLVSVPAAHGLLGTVAPVTEIIDRVRDHSRAWVLVDATAYAPYRVVNPGAWGADIVALDVSALGGPQVAALVFRDEAMFRRLDTISPQNSNSGACKLSLDVSAGLAGGVSPLVDHLANLVPHPDEEASRRDRLTHSMVELGLYLDNLRDDLYTFLGTLPAVHILGVSGEAAADAEPNRLPRLSFGVRGVPAEMVYQRLVDNRLITTVTPRSQLLQDMGVDEIGGAVTVALGPFIRESDVDHLIRVVASLA